MEVVVFSPSSEPDDREVLAVKNMFKIGLQTYHLLKQRLSEENTIRFLNCFSKEERRGIIFHGPATLASEFDVKYWPAGQGIIHNFRELINAPCLPYLFLSPVFKSISKSGYGPGWKIEEIKEAIGGANSPLYALGGIRTTNISIVRDLGFRGIGVLGAVWNSLDPVGAFREILAVTKSFSEVTRA
jgi:thiamine-phosphate pyrophosphorylase